MLLDEEVFQVRIILPSVMFDHSNLGIHKQHRTTIVSVSEQSKKMAKSVVTFFLNKLDSLITDEVRHLGSVDEQVRLLHEELEFINSFLRDADRKARKNETVNTWVRQVRDLTFDAEDAIDFLFLKTEQQRQRNIGFRFVCYPCKVISLHELGKQINLINRRIEKISNNKLKYVETLESAETSSHSNQERRTPIELDVVGFKKEAEELATMLTFFKSSESTTPCSDSTTT